MSSLDSTTTNIIFMSSVLIMKFVISHKIIIKDSWHFVRMVKYFSSVDRKIVVDARVMTSHLVNIRCSYIEVTPVYLNILF
jgi:hypothetical protein